MSRALPIVAGAAFLLLATVCLFVNAPRIEADIRDRSEGALASAGLSEVNLEISGRDVTLSGRQTVLDQAGRALSTIAGIRNTTMIPTAEPTPPQTAPVTQAAPQEPAPEIAMEDRIRDLVSERPIRFRTGSAELLPESRIILDELSSLLAGSDFGVEIEGHTDATGSAQRNLTLSQERAEAVMAYLRAGGIAPDRMTATGVGAARPIAPNTTAAGRRLNRRIEFNVTSPN